MYFLVEKKCVSLQMLGFIWMLWAKILCDIKFRMVQQEKLRGAFQTRLKKIDWQKKYFVRRSN